MKPIPQLRAILERPILRAIALLVAALATGVASGHGNLALMPCCFLFIALFRYAPTRSQRALAIGYYGGFTITMFPGAAIFFGHEFNPFGIFILWLGISTALAAPWALLCRPDPVRLAWAVPFTIGLETLPPLGLIAVGNPLNSAGVLFPHAGWFGLAVVFLFSSLPAIFPRYTLAAIALIVGITSLLAHPPKAPADWQGDQRIPIPFTMWNPLASPTVPLNLYGSAMLHTHHQNAALFICYEQLLALPLAQSMMEKPTLLVGIANDYWAKGTYFPAIQLQNLRAWGQLFNVPVVTAVNE